VGREAALEGQEARRRKSSRCSPHSLISTKSSMPDNVAQSTSNSISGRGYSTRQRVGEGPTARLDFLRRFLLSLSETQSD
jgi:hypothetical protein